MFAQSVWRIRCSCGSENPKEDMINVVFTGEHQGLAMPHHLPVAGYLNM